MKKKMFNVMIQFMNHKGEVTEESLMASCPSENVANMIKRMLERENNESYTYRYVIKES